MKLCYESKFKNSKITLKKRPAIILSDPNYKVVLTVQYDMARYNNEQDAEEAVTGKLISDPAVLVEEPEFDMMAGAIRILLDDLAKFGTLVVAYYRTPIWEIYWKFVESKFMRYLDKLLSHLIIFSRRSQKTRERGSGKVATGPEKGSSFGPR